MKLSGWTVERVGGAYVYIRKIPLLPPLIMKVQYPTPPLPFAQIEKLIQQYKPLKIQIQPLKTESGLKKFGYKPTKEGGHVTKTIQLDLTQSEEKILRQMKKDARYGIKRAKSQDIEIQRVKSREVKIFHQSWRESVGWRRYVPSLKTLQNLQKAFGQDALFIAGSGKNTSEESDVMSDSIRGEEGQIAGTIILIADKTAYYYYAFTSKVGRENFAQYFLVWEAIKLAKKQGCQIFDFEGIYDKRFPIKSWQGFSHFKKGFGGKMVEYPGCFVKHRWL